jgi:hypothetical protein
MLFCPLDGGYVCQCGHTENKVWEVKDEICSNSQNLPEVLSGVLNKAGEMPQLQLPAGERLEQGGERC